MPRPSDLQRVTDMAVARPTPVVLPPGFGRRAWYQPAPSVVGHDYCCSRSACAPLPSLPPGFDQHAWYQALFDFGMPEDPAALDPADPDANLVPQLVQVRGWVGRWVASACFAVLPLRSCSRPPARRPLCVNTLHAHPPARLAWPPPPPPHTPQKLVLPLARRLLAEVWSPWSRRQSGAAAAMLADLLVYVPPEEEGLQVGGCSRAALLPCALPRLKLGHAACKRGRPAASKRAAGAARLALRGCSPRARPSHVTILALSLGRRR